MVFLDRIEELSSLRRAYECGSAQFYVLYGRRRLGKTTLLRRFAEGLPATVYHVADRSNARDARRFLAGSIAISLDEPSFALAEYPDWYALFAAYDRIRPEGRNCLILDEYQYLCEMEPAFSSILQKHWDAVWSRSDFMLVLCGSALSMMYKETLSHASPLYGRRTGQILLKPMSFNDVSDFFKSGNSLERLKMWSLTGGVPYYAELTGVYDPFSEALRECVLKKDGVLYAEVRFLLQEELQSPNTYWSLLRTIASGANRMSEIAGRLGTESGRLTPYLSALREMSMISRKVSVTEKNPETSKRGIYVLEDHFLRLWFSCVAPLESLLELGRVKQVEEMIAMQLNHHFSWAFERAAREHLQNSAEKLGLFDVGQVWDGKAEFDVVGVDREKNPVIVGECKWSEQPVGIEVAQKLKLKAESFWPSRAQNLRYAVFASNGFSRNLHDWAEENRMMLIDAESMGNRVTD